jgi:hypothetical protein
MSRKAIPSRTQNQGLKLLISAAAVTATIGGWAALSAPAPTASAPAAAEVAGAVPAWLLEPPRIPTLAAGSAAPAPQPQTPAVRAPLPVRPAPITNTRSSR